MEVLDFIEQMINDRKGTKVILATMPFRTLEEQNQVWTIGLGKMAVDAAAKANRIARTIQERIKDGFMDGLFFIPLDEAEAYVRDELRLSRARVMGEEKRQSRLEDILMEIGAARALGYDTINDYQMSRQDQEPTGTDG